MKRVAIVLALLSLVFVGSACRDEGTLEKAGREMDETIDRIEHPGEGDFERAGRKLDERVERDEEELEDSD